MSYLDTLLLGAEVEWKTLGEVGELVRGNGLPKSDFTDTGIPAIHYGQIYTYYGTFTTETKSFVSVETASKLKKVNTGDVIITNTSENLDDVGKSVVYLGKEQAVTGGHATIFKPSKLVTGKYFAYFTQTEMFAVQKRKYAKGTKVIDVSAIDLGKIQIPIPALKVQKEIVRILDTFTELTAELTVELTARKKQYSYYREQLLSFEEGVVEWKMLQEVGEIRRGVAFTKRQALLGKYPVVANSAEPICYHNEFNRDGEFIVVARSGANAGMISYWNEEIFLTDAFSIHTNNSVLNTKFAYYYFKKYQDEIHLMKEGGGVPHVRASEFEVYNIPIPALEEQERIVSILDKFDILTTSISEGLPKEIELRKKQYEYYRNQLLTFNGK